QADVIDFVNTSLGVGVECADAVHFVVEQLDAVRYWAPHRKQIDNAAANAKFARRDDLSDMGIAGETQLLAQGFGRQSGALPEEEGVPGNETGGRQSVQRGGDRDDCNVEGLVRNLIKGGETLRNQVLVRRKTVIGECLPVRQQEYPEFGREERQFHAQAFGVLRCFGQYQQRSGATHERGQRQGVGG